MKKIVNPCLLPLFLCLVFFIKKGHSQNYIQAQIIVPQPVPTTSPEVLGRTGETVLILTNTHPSEKFEVMIGATIKGNNGVTGSVDPRGKRPARSILLQPGMPEMFTGDDLLNIFGNYTIDDIEYSGIDLKDLAINPKFPEGTYTVCVTVYDYNTKEQLSAPQPMNCSAPITVRTPDPPVITNPQNGDVLEWGPFEAIPFRWTNVTLPGKMFYYDFVLAEVPKGVNPYDAIESKNFQIYTEEKMVANVLVYDQTKPPLPDGSYAVQVRAYDPEGLVDVKNGGLSDVVVFHLKERLLEPPRLLSPRAGAELANSDSHRFRWTALTAGNAPINYRLQVAVFKGEGTHESTFENPDLVLLDEGGMDANSFTYEDGFDPYITYLARVQAYDKTGSTVIENGGWSNIHAFSIEPPQGQEQETFACGEGCTTARPTGLAVNSFRTGSQVKMGNFTLQLNNVSVSGTTYNGSAQILPGSFFDSPIEVELLNARFNAQGKAIAGMAQASLPSTSSVPSNWGTFGGSMSHPSNPGNARSYLSSNALELGNGNPQASGLPLKFGNIYITALQLTPTTAKANLVSIWQLWQAVTTQGYLVFGKKNICISPGGPAVGGSDARLPLLRNATVEENSHISVTILKNGSGAPNGGTVLPFDCGGAKPMLAVGYVTFSDPEIKVKSGNSFRSGRSIYGQFATEIADWRNWLAGLQFVSSGQRSNFGGNGQPVNFQLDELRGFEFEASTANYDHSFSQNVLGFSPVGGSQNGSFGSSSTSAQGMSGNPAPSPAGQISSQNMGAVHFGGIGQLTANAMQGIVFQDAKIYLPAYFKKENGDKLGIDFPNLYYSWGGLNGSLNAEFQRAKLGSIGDWGARLNGLNISIFENGLEEAAYGGELAVAFFRDRFPFSAEHGPGQDAPTFDVELPESNRINLWKANVALESSSSISSFFSSGQLYVLASFSGSLTFDNRIDDIRGLQLRNIGFNGMILWNRTDGPFGRLKPMSVGSFRIPSSAQKIAGYPADIRSVRLRELANRDLELKFNYDFKFDDNLNGLNARTDLKIKLRKNGQNWERRSSTVTSISFDEDLPGLSVNGRVRYTNHPDGYDFRGSLDADFLNGYAEVNIDGILGVNRNRRYWSLLAQAKWDEPVTIFTGINMRAFGGGAYYNMVKESSSTSGSFDDISFRPKTSGSTTFGILANTLLQSEKPSEFNGRFLLEVDLNDWSLSDIRLSGYAHFFDEMREENFWLTNSEPAGNAQIKLDGEVRLKWSGAKFLSANLGYDINLKPNGILTGRRSNALRLYFSSSSWYIKLGTPNNPLPLTYSPRMRVNGTNYSIGNINTHSYFITGSFGNAQAGLEIDYTKSWFWDYEIGFANRFWARVDFDFDMDGAIGYGLTNCSNHDPDDFFAILSGAISLSGTASYWDRCNSWNPLDWGDHCNRWRSIGGSFGLSGNFYTPDPTGLEGTLEVGFSYGGDTYGIDLPFRLGSRCE